MGNIFKPCGNSELTNHLRNQLNETNKNKINYSSKYYLNRSTNGNTIKVPRQFSPTIISAQVIQFTTICRVGKYLFCMGRENKVYPVLLPFNLQNLMQEKYPNTGCIVQQVPYNAQWSIELTVEPPYSEDSTNPIFYTNILAVDIYAGWGNSFAIENSNSFISPALGKYLGKEIFTTRKIQLTEDIINQFISISKMNNIYVESNVNFMDINVDARTFVMTNYI